MKETRRDGSPLLESAVEAYLDKRVRQIGGRTFKFTGDRGTPDRVVVFPYGRVFFVELKQLGKKPDPMQVLWHGRALQMGHVVHVIDSREMVDDFIQWVMEEDVRAPEAVTDEYRAMQRRYKEEA